jgi:hypothetical protein
MGRIIASATISNASDPSKSLRGEALVDPGAAYMTLPIARQERLGELEEIRRVQVESATQAVAEGSICGPNPDRRVSSHSWGSLVPAHDPAGWDV